ncbi:sterol desaturase family protein [uncultured Microscilla sp.]|uniref:sterol desaturase family protein n=1 Tax=uncultured Microscilla sp. TaxID=432653 RepID=UPI00262FCEC5|nr:sterol desaturase family protein [uncultured Microscilla sp.]
MLVDDFSQYWYHRSAHEYPFLWKLHRPHHAAPEMGVLVTYREAFLYPIFIPSVWWMGICLFLGLAKAIALGVIIKQLVLISSHSNWKWDRYLYKNKITKTIMWVVRRIIVTPTFHHAHHGLTAKDGISNPHGNFGNLFSIWDQLFGTAMYTNEFPKRYGIENNPNEGWLPNYFYPFITSQKENSELNKNFVKQSYITAKPLNITLDPGQYLYCTCGLSSQQPFCNSSHNGTKHKPMFFTTKKTQKVSLCQCKLTQTPPYCDGAHKKLKEKQVQNNTNKASVSN